MISIQAGQRDGWSPQRNGCWTCMQSSSSALEPVYFMKRQMLGARCCSPLILMDVIFSALLSCFYLSNSQRGIGAALDACTIQYTRVMEVKVVLTISKMCRIASLHNPGRGTPFRWSNVTRSHRKYRERYNVYLRKRLVSQIGCVHRHRATDYQAAQE